MKTRILLTTVCATIFCMLAVAQTTGKFTPPDSGRWYRLVTRYNGGDQRVGTCIQYFHERSDMLYGAKPLDSGAEGYDNQFWRFEEDPDNPGSYALICRGDERGYLSAIPRVEGEVVTSVSQLGSNCRWVYVTEPTENPADKYGFQFVTEGDMGGVDENTNNSYAGISTAQILKIADNNTNGNVYMNCGSSKVGYAINIWSHAYDENANEWIFSLIPEDEVTTGIEDDCVSSDGNDETVYNLMGQPVANPGHGLYIIGGKKVRL